MHSNPRNIIHSATPRHGIASRVFSVGSFQRERKEPVLPLLRMTKHQSAPLSTDSSGAFPSLTPSRCLKLGPCNGSHNPTAMEALRSCLAWLQTTFACLFSRPPVLKRRCCKLVSFQLPILRGNTSRRQRFPKLLAITLGQRRTSFDRKWWPAVASYIIAYLLQGC